MAFTRIAVNQKNQRFFRGGNSAQQGKRSLFPVHKKQS